MQPQHAQQRTTCAGTALNAAHQVICSCKRKNMIQHSVTNPPRPQKGRQTRGLLPLQRGTSPGRSFKKPYQSGHLHQNQNNCTPTNRTVCLCQHILCRTFAQVQSTLDVDTISHPTPFLFTTAMKLGDIITSQPLQVAIAGHSKQTLLVLYTVLACLEMIATCIGKEASNPDVLQMHAETIGHHPNLLGLQQQTRP